MLPPPQPIDPARDALFLDFDGTLAAIVERPADAALWPGMAELLARAQRLIGGRVAIVSGRSIAMLERLVPLPGLMLVGIHGLERRWPDGRLERPDPAEGLGAARARLARFVNGTDGLHLEDKALSVAVHYRGAAHLAQQVLKEAASAATAHGLAVQTGKMVAELRTPGADKGAALTALMQAPPFRGARPLMVGDDDTDETAFRAAVALGGGAVRVGDAPAGSAATAALPDVAAVARWLGALA